MKTQHINRTRRQDRKTEREYESLDRDYKMFYRSRGITPEPISEGLLPSNYEITEMLKSLDI